MKTLCVMDSVSRANGGIFEAERRLQQTLSAEQNIAVQVVGVCDSHTEADRSAWHPLIPLTYPVLGPQSLGFAPKFADALLESDADLAYCAGLWKYPSAAALHWARRTRKPVIVAPHGMLDPWAIHHSHTKKKIAGWLFQNALLKRASCLRALCSAEAAAIRDYGLKQPICIIPNGVDLPLAFSTQPPSPFPPKQKMLLYLGRIHPKKGLANLLVAWSKAARTPGAEKWVLAIAGWDQGCHQAKLEKLASLLGIHWVRKTSPSTDAASLLFPGPQYREAKAAAFLHCDAFILPSVSEGLPMSVLEAWSYRKPVLMTPQCNLPEGFTESASLRIEPTPQGIEDGLETLFCMSRQELGTMGERGAQLVRKRFAWPRIAGDMARVYHWAVGGGPKPDCVDF